MHLPILCMSSKTFFKHHVMSHDIMEQFSLFPISHTDYYSWHRVLSTFASQRYVCSLIPTSSTIKSPAFKRALFCLSFTCNNGSGTCKTFTLQTHAHTGRGTVPLKSAAVYPCMHVNTRRTVAYK